MVKRLIALTASAVCTLAVSASAAESPDTAPSAAPEVIQHVLSLHDLERGKLDGARMRIEAAIEKLRGAGEIEGVNKDELIAQLEAAVASLEAELPELVELKAVMNTLVQEKALAKQNGVPYKPMDEQAIQELRKNALILRDQALQYKHFGPGEAPQIYRLEELRSLSDLGQPLTPEQLAELKALPQQIHELYLPREQADDFDPKRAAQLDELRQYEAGGTAPRVFTPQQLDELKQTYKVFTPEQIAELKALGKADISAGHPGWAPIDPQLHEQIAQLVHEHALTAEQVAELHEQIQALVEQYIDEHAAAADNDEDSSSEDDED